MMARRTAGKLGCGGGPSNLFSPLRGCEAAMLEKGIGDHCHQGMAVKPMPGSPFEVVEAELFLQLLMRLFTDPTRLDGAGERFDRRLAWQVREVILALSTGAMFSDQPGLVARHVLVTHVANALRRSVGDPHTHSGEARRQTPFRAAAPADRAPG